MQRVRLKFVFGVEVPKGPPDPPQSGLCRVCTIETKMANPFSRRIKVFADGMAGPSVTIDGGARILLIPKS